MRAVRDESLSQDLVSLADESTSNDVITTAWRAVFDTRQETHRSIEIGHLHQQLQEGRIDGVDVKEADSATRKIACHARKRIAHGTETMVQRRNRNGNRNRLAGLTPAISADVGIVLNDDILHERRDGVCSFFADGCCHLFLE